MLGLPRGTLQLSRRKPTQGSTVLRLWRRRSSSRTGGFTQPSRAVTANFEVTEVPEPTTMLVGALLLLLIGLSTIRFFRKQRAACGLGLTWENPPCLAKGRSQQPACFAHLIVARPSGDFENPTRSPFGFLTPIFSLLTSKLCIRSLRRSTSAFAFHVSALLSVVRSQLPCGFICPASIFSLPTSLAPASAAPSPSVVRSVPATF
jgi:hypothetical protein